MVGAIPRDLLYNVSAPAIAQHIVHNISGTIGFDLEWPTLANDVRPIVTKPLGMVAPCLRNQWIQSPHTLHTLDHNMQSIY
jgi:hypothetical protein